MNPPPRSIINRSATNGMILSAWLSAIVLCYGLSVTVCPPLVLLLLLLAAALLLSVYFILRRSYLETDFKAGFMELWSEGTLSFILGSLIPALIIYAGLRWAAPTLIADLFDSSVTFLDASGDPKLVQLAETLRKSRQSIGLPQPSDICAQYIAMTTLYGAVLSLISSIILKIQFISPLRRQRLQERKRRG